MDAFGIFKMDSLQSGVLNAVDFLNTWGLIAIGLGLILGLFTRAAAISGAILLFVYYLNNPPLIGLGIFCSDRRKLSYCQQDSY